MEKGFPGPKQTPPLVSDGVLDQVTPENARILISLSKQRGYLMLDKATAVDSPVCTGKASTPTPRGNFTVIAKNPDSHSDLYGNFVDSHGCIICRFISVKTNPPPEGTHFEGAPMKWFMQLTTDGVGMHGGDLPGRPSSHGCIRFPLEIAARIYQKVRVGTPVEITD
jgi:lipoprotein-anchoring transpeptidase ErfK/SrfK